MSFLFALLLICSLLFVKITQLRNQIRCLLIHINALEFENTRFADSVVAVILEIMTSLAASGENTALLTKRLKKNFSFRNSNIHTLAGQITPISDRYCHGMLSRLKKKYPLLNQSDLDFCGMLSIGLSSAEISLAYGYDHPATFYNKRYKIRKKMNLPASTDLEEYLRGLIIEAERAEKEAIRQGIENKSLDSVLNILSLQKN